MAFSTPWGPSQHTEKLIQGVSIVSTAGHGGMMISAKKAENLLSEAARKMAIFDGRYYAFEEDCAFDIPLFESEEIRVAFIECMRSTNNAEDIKDSAWSSLSRWYPKYLIEVGVKPEDEGYKIYLEEKERDRLRNERSPDLIISAVQLDEDQVKVITADDMEHHVRASVYSNYNHKRVVLRLSDIRKLEQGLEIS